MHWNGNFYIFLSFISALCTVFPLQMNADNRIGLKTVVIDAGHGGKDAGSVSKDGKTYEKTLTLDIAKKFGKQITEAYPDVKVIYTRNEDVYKTLNERAAIANKNNANLFVSIHINSNKKSTVYGPSVHILGQSQKNDVFAGNMNVCRQENSVILLEEDYSTNYQGFDPSSPESFIFFSLMQNAFYEQSIMFASEVDKELHKSVLRTSNYTGIHQDPFWLLWKTSMPAALVELGFISNTEDLKILRTDSGRAKLANSLFKAFAAFKTNYDRSLNLENNTKEKVREKEENKNASGDVPSNGGQTRYGIQIMCSGKVLKSGNPLLKNYNAESFKVEGRPLYKYVVEISEDKTEVKSRLSAVRKNFSDAFLVKIEDGKVCPEK